MHAREESASSARTRHSTSSSKSSISHPTTPNNSPPSSGTQLNELVQRLCVEAMAQHQCIISCSPVQLPPAAAAAQSPLLPPHGGPASPTDDYCIHLSGGYQQVMAARGTVLRENPFGRQSVVKVPRSEVLDAKSDVKPEMRRKLDEIASLTKAHVAIRGQAGAAIGFGLETERNVEIHISGPFESVEQARVRLLVLLDELSGLHSEVCEIDYKLHNIISGRKRCVVQQIQEETATNVYFPTPLSGVIGHKNGALLAKQNLIFITGEYFGVQRARDMLFQVSLHKSKCIISRDTAILPRKLDWILTDRLDDARQIMHDNGTFINFPPTGSQASLISVYGDHRVNIERTIRAVMQLACQFYVASFWLLPASFDIAMMLPPSINPAQVPGILRHLAVTSGAEAVFKSNCFELHGLESEVRQAISLVLELDFIKTFHHEMRFQVELANEHRDFISGKKNGKLNKIMKTANVKIKFETFNDYNFLIDVAGADQGALHGLSLVQEELPAEASFHVPEAYHKRIIGVGGKNIQRIMKKHGVYVKFSNADEFAALGGYADNEDNVIARTPAKNALELEHLKQAVMELVSPKDKDFVVESVAIPRRYHRTLLGEKAIFIHDIEAKTNSIVRFPNKEAATDQVSIFGPESQVHIAAQMLLDHVPFEAEYRLPHSAEMAQLALSPDFVSLTEQVKRDLNITILPWVDRSGAGEEAIIRFCLNRSHVDFLATARDMVEEYLVARKIALYPGSLRPRSDAFAADPFPFFNSALIQTVAGDKAPEQGATSRASHVRAGGPVGVPGGNMGMDRSKLRMAASSPNIKAIFDASPTPPMPFGYRQPNEQSFPGFYQPQGRTAPQLDTAGYPLQAAAAAQAAAGQDKEYAGYGWGAATQQRNMSFGGYLPSAFAPGHGVPAAGRLSYDENAAVGGPTESSRQAHAARVAAAAGRAPGTGPAGQGGAPALPGSAEDQLRDMVRKPRTLGHRAQSLDLSQHSVARQAHKHTPSLSVHHQSPARRLHHNAQSVDEAGDVLAQLGLN